MTVTLFCRGCDFQVAEEGEFDISPMSRSSKQTTRHDADREARPAGKLSVTRSQKKSKTKRVEIDPSYGQQNICC